MHLIRHSGSKSHSAVSLLTYLKPVCLASSATCHHISASSYAYISCKLHSNANEEAAAELKQTAITARA